MPLDGEIFFELGLATRMRRLADNMSADLDKIYEEENSVFRARYFYVVYMLVNYGSMPIAEIAKLSGFTHSSVSQTVSKLRALDIVETSSTEDARQKQVSLSKHGQSLLAKIQPIWDAADRALKKVTNTSAILESLAALEDAFSQQSAYDRFREALITPRQAEYSIEPYHVKYKQAFYDLNAAWIRDFFTIEPIDEKVLSNPEDYILAKGGELFFAISNNKPVGTVAMKADGDGTYELTKLGVDPSMREGGIGSALCLKVVERFEARGGKLLYLDTSSPLKNAIRLYKNLGFIEKEKPVKSAYARADYYMEWPNGNDT